MKKARTKNKISPSEHTLSSMILVCNLNNFFEFTELFDKLCSSCIGVILCCNIVISTSDSVRKSVCYLR